VIVTNCCNNYGPFQYPEKLIPLTILNALSGQALPVYGDGQNVRDWLYVEDHCDALRTVLARGKPGETYNIGGSTERTNIEVVKMICDLVDELHLHATADPWKQVKYVKDRPGHDRRYAIDSSKIMGQLGWRPKESFELGMRKTVAWYVSNMQWVNEIRSGAYCEWIQKNYGGR
jgi:dTDP-glucose 4,6-dehydratase